jgi:rfaE bifunctional protein kinase chain/domain/rfaE bifunctional protein nucleotidyltransferase chain/domain
MAQSFERKIVDESQLQAAVAQARAAGQTIVHCHGCFDIVHPGHIRYLQFAREQGDLLIVTLTADAAISKRELSPYIPQELRAENLAALELVDLVYVDPSPTAESVLAALRPDVYVKGREYESSQDAAFLRERRIVEASGGRVIFSSGETVFSSTKLIEQLPRDAALEHQRLALIRRRHGIGRHTLLQALGRFRGLRVAVIGDVILDRYVFCDATDVASESPMMSLTQLRDECYAGGAAIVARHVAGLGAKAFLLSAASDDALSARIIETLDREAVAHYLLKSRPTVVEKTRFLVEEHKVFKVERAARIPLDSRAEQVAARALQSRVEGFDAVVLCDFGYGMITAGLLNQILPDLAARDLVVAGDVSGMRGNLLEFRGVDLLCPTERELRATLHDFDRGLSSVAWNLLDKTQAKSLIVTLGKRGLVTFERRSDEPRSEAWSGRLLSEHLPAFPAPGLDPLGGGDALLATASLGLATGLSLMQAAWLGNLAAAIETAHLGNIPLDRGELREAVLGCTEPEAQEAAASAPDGVPV